MKKLFAMSFILIFVLSACNLLLPATPTVDPVAVAIAQTMAVQSAAQTLVAQMQPTVAPTAALPPTQAIPPTVEPTVAPPTPEPVVQITATAFMNANCRSGPGGNFTYLGVLNNGETAVVLGKNLDNGTWWKVTLPNLKECWVTGDAVNVTGDVTKVALLVSPPTPTPIPPPNWSGQWVILFSDEPTRPEANASVINITMTQTGNALFATFTSVKYGDPIKISATVSADGKTVTGSLTYGSTPYVIYLVRNPDDVKQFRGKFYRATDPGFDGAICGGTLGASYPSPCRP
jgi:uncharacterized protein YgiM (DUF1202 family)